MNFRLGVGTREVRFGLIPNFALGSIADVSSPASPGGDSLVFGVGTVNRRFDVRGVKIGDIGITSPSCGVTGRVTGGITKGQRLDAEGSGNGKGPHRRLVLSGTDSMPSVDTIRLAPRPRSWLSRSFGSREVEEARMFPSPPLPNWKGSDQIKCGIYDAFNAITDDPPRQQPGGTAERL